MKNKIFKNIRVEEILFGVLFLSVFLVSSKNLYVHFSLPKLACLRLLTILILILWIYRFIKNDTKSIPFSILFSTSLLALWWVSTTFYSVHIPTALNGFFGRYNGLWSHLTFLLLFVICSSLPLNFKRIETIFKLFITSLIPVSLYALYQLILLNINLTWSIERPFSTIGHPVILAALLGLALPFSLIFFLQANNNRSKLVWGIPTLIIILAIISTLSRGPWIGCILSIAIVTKTYFNNRPSVVKKNLTYILSIIAVFVLVYIGLNTDFRNRLQERFIFNSASIQHRQLFHKSAVAILNDYPVAGIGFECFRIMYPYYRLPEDTDIRKNKTPTMVHNGYLQTAVTNGIPALFLYIILIFCVLRLLYKTKNCGEKELRYFLTACIASIAGYLVQDLSGWLEVALTPFFWIMLGLSVSACKENNQHYEKTKFKLKKIIVLIFAILSLVALLLLFNKTLKNIYIDHMLWKSNKLILTNIYRIDPYISSALKKNPDDFFYEDIAGLLYLKKFIGDGKRDTYKNSVKLLENAHFHNPYDPFVLIRRIQLDVIALKKGIISVPTVFTEQAVKTVIGIDKYNPNIYEVIGKLRLEEKRLQEALTFFAKAKKLRE